MEFAYIRVSSKDQNIDRQEQAINEYCAKSDIVLHRIFIDKASGKDFNRVQYQALKLCLRQGDTIIIKELDRLGRNMESIKSEWYDLQAMGVDIIVIDTLILNTNNKSDLEKALISNIVFELLSYMAEKERIKIHQRQAEGIAAARIKGKHLGRPKKQLPDDFMQVYQKWKDNEITATAAMRILNFSSTTFYRKAKEIKEFENHI